MKLIKAHVKNFRSVEDSEEFTLENVTCLVGKNEAGKSAILMALAALNPHPATIVNLDKERDYPRRFLTQYASRHPDKHAVSITTTWEISDAEVKEIESTCGRGILQSREVKIARRYDADRPEWQFSIDFTKACEGLFERFKLDATERASLKTAPTTDALRDLLRKLEAPSEKQKALLADLDTHGSVTTRVSKLLSGRLPKFMYFSSYDRMEGAVQVEKLQELAANGQINEPRYSGLKLFREFLEYAGVPLDQILSVKTYETFNAQLKGASNNITDQILEYWTQNPDLGVEVTIAQARSGDPAPFNSGTVARARVSNLLHRVDTPFSERSAGFVWFFSFLVKFAQVKDEETPVVLLLDEPGLSLHGKAQGDLLRFFDEKLAPHHQIIYSTHSPFMVAHDKLLSARIVEDQVRVDPRSGRRSPIGTKVRSDVLTRDPDTLFPLQGALGYEITQTLFIGRRTLLVEGPGDIVYLKALSAALGRRRKVVLDPSWTLCPSGGIGNIKSFVSLFGGNRLDVAVLTDFALGSKSEVERLKSSKLLASERVLSLHEFTGKAESDIEDLFEPAVFVALLNQCYGFTGKGVLTEAALEASDKSVRLVKKAEAWFRTNPPPSGEEFDHYRPAEWLLLNPAFLDTDSVSMSATLERAEKVVAAINQL